MNFKSLFGAAAVALTAGMLSVAPANAAFVNTTDNLWNGNFDDGVVSSLGPVNLSNGTINVQGQIDEADTDAGITFDVFANPLLAGSVGATQIILNVLGSSITNIAGSYDGVALVFDPVATGFQAKFSSTFTSTADLDTFLLTFEDAVVGDSVQITISAVPLPAAGLLLVGGLGALGGLGFVGRRRNAPAMA